jgi:predicted transcriptional regulator
MGATITERDAWFHRQVRVGLDAANAGDVISAEEVEAEAAAWRIELRRKMSSANA